MWTKLKMFYENWLVSEMTIKGKMLFFLFVLDLLIIVHRLPSPFEQETLKACVTFNSTIVARNIFFFF